MWMLIIFITCNVLIQLTASLNLKFFPTVLSKIYTINILSSQYLIRYYCKYRHSHYILLIEYLLQDVLQLTKLKNKNSLQLQTLDTYKQYKVKNVRIDFMSIKQNVSINSSCTCNLISSNIIKYFKTQNTLAIIIMFVRSVMLNKKPY